MSVRVVKTGQKGPQILSDGQIGMLDEMVVQRVGNDLRRLGKKGGAGWTGFFNHSDGFLGNPKSLPNGTLLEITDNE